MVFGYRLRGLLSPLLNGGDISCFLDTVSRGATEVCEEFYDTLILCISHGHLCSLPGGGSPNHANHAPTSPVASPSRRFQP